MPIHTFIVEVETEREGGLHASRDDINEKLEEAIDEAVQSADLSGLGARGDSEYSIANTSIDSVDTRNKAGRDALMEYDSHVLQDLPGDEELRKQNRALKRQLEDLNRTLTQVKDRNIALQEEQESKRTRVWSSDSASRRDGVVHYLPDGQYDRIYMQYGDRDDEVLQLSFSQDGVLEVMNQGWKQLVIVPHSGNVVRLKGQDRQKGDI